VLHRLGRSSKSHFAYGRIVPTMCDKSAARQTFSNSSNTYLKGMGELEPAAAVELIAIASQLEGQLIPCMDQKPAKCMLSLALNRQLRQLQAHAAAECCRLMRIQRREAGSQV
jgi:hypothetical protein